MSVHALTERAMTMNLSIGIWAGYRLDKEASRKITEESNAHADAARVNKHLVPKEALAPIVSAQNAIRTHFYTKTLPWRDNGDRLMTRTLYMDFIREHEQLVGEFRKAVRKFLDDDYPAAIAQAEFRMGDLFKRDDYPTASQLEHRFYATLDVDAVTTSNDFRVAIDEAHVAKVRASMESAAERRIHAAMQDIWVRLAKVIEQFHERMSTPDAVFRDTTVTNVAELIDLIPGLNVLDDPNIEAIRQLVERKLVGADPKEIRKDAAYRGELADGAKEIMDRMSGFMKAFGAGNA